MTTITLKGAVFYDTASYADATGRFKFFVGIADAFSGYVPVCAHEFSIDLPPNFDPRTAEVRELEKKERDLRDEFSTKVMQIRRRISELQAIEYSPKEVA